MEMLHGIDLLKYQQHLRVTRETEVVYILDPVRKKRIIATPEEIVRQMWILYLTEEFKIPFKRIAIERAFSWMGMRRRFDMVIFDGKGKPQLLAECKAPEIELGQSTVDQIARYNIELNIPFALISNGRTHYCFSADEGEQKIQWHHHLPL